MQGQKKCAREYQCLPEEGVVLNADLPQSLRGPMVGQLEAYGALKLFILSSGGRGGGGGGGGREVKKKRRVKGASAGKDGGMVAG